MKIALRDKNVIFKKITVFCLSILLILFTLKRLFVAGDLDQWTAITEAYRLSIGETPFIDLWSPHSLSYLSLALLEKIWVYFTGTTSGIVLWCRFMSFIFQIFVGVFFYCSIKDICKNYSYLIFIILMGYLTKKMLLLEYGNLTVWLTMLCNAVFLLYCRNKKTVYLYLFGIIFFGLIMSFPSYGSMVLFYLPLFLLTCKDKKEMIRVFFIVFITDAVCFAVLIAFLLNGNNLSELVDGILSTLASSGYKQTFMQSLLLKYIKPLCHEVIDLIPVVVVSYIFYRFIKKEDENKCDRILIIFYTVDITYELILNFYKHYDWNLRFLPILVAIGLYYAYKDKEKKWFILIATGVGSLLCTLALSVLSVSGVYRAMFPGAVFALIYLIKIEKKYAKKYLCFTLISIVLTALFFIRPTGGKCGLFDYQYFKATEGPMAGIYIQETEYENYQKLISISKKYLDDNSSIAYFGSNNSIYLMGEYIHGVPSCVINAWSEGNGEKYLSYYEKHREKIPNVIIIEIECPINPSYKNLKMKEMINSEIIHWIEENYYLECELDNHFIYRMRKN